METKIKNNHICCNCNKCKIIEVQRYVITMFVLTETTKNKLTQRAHAIWVSGTKTQMDAQIGNINFSQPQLRLGADISTLSSIGC